MLRILLCNDDGYLAPGILALYEALQALPDVQVELLAPEHNNSAKSNALTVHAPLYVRTGPGGLRYVNGTPADCIHIALTGLLDYRPDLVVSGINNGANMGDDTLYSGTVGAAMEAYLFGIPGIAFSLVERDWAHLDAAAYASALLVEQLTGQGLHRQGRWLLNVNIPNLPLALLKPLKWCRLGRRHAAERVICQQNPHGETMYWIGACGAADDASAGTDFDAVAAGHVAITPLQVDLTDHAAMAAWQQQFAVERFCALPPDAPTPMPGEPA